MGSVANTDVTIPDAVVPKREFSLERYSSSPDSTLEGEDGVTAGDEQAPSAPAPAPKRKGGRKPVSQLDLNPSALLTQPHRSMQHRRSGSREIDRHKRPFANDVLNTSNN